MTAAADGCRYLYGVPGYGEAALFVADANGDGRWWCVYYRDRRGRRVMMGFPARQSRDAAQADLDAWAKKKRLKEVE